MIEPLDRLKDALKDRYAFERELGSGGMATVWLAQDLKHHREVAVKVLRPELAATIGPERFLREVDIAANLQHPHILPLHDSGEADGFLYYVMPYVEGQTVRQRLLRERELPVGEAARILRDVADAMAAAHAKGVVHRDLKPENIMLTGRHALVADFGVAKAVSEATGQQHLTTKGVALGTPTYMAPEQAAADPLTDHRADIYALGVVAYEMLTGEPPFVRTTAQAMMAAHLTEAPVAVTERRGTIPPALAAMVMKCLEKKPADRPQRAEELLGVLEGLSTPSGGLTPAETQPVRVRGRGRKVGLAAAGMATVGLVALGAWALLTQGGPLPDAKVRQPVVVLPFEVQGGDAALASLGIQAADRITAAIEGASLGGVVKYRPEGGGKPFTERLGRRVLRETGAATLVVGTIAQRGDQVEVQAQVVRGSDLQTLWTLGPEYGSASNPTQALDAIQKRVLGAVGWYVSPATEHLQNPGGYQPPPSLDVLRLALRANELWRREQRVAAVPLLQEACLRDSTWLPGPLWLARYYSEIIRPQARDSVLPWLEARRERLYPLDALTLNWVQGYVGSPESRYRAALALYEADAGWAFEASQAALNDRRPEEALRYYALRDTATAFGAEWQAWDNVAGQAYHMRGRFEEELALARAAKAREPTAIQHWGREVSALAALGRADEIERIVNESYRLETRGAPEQLSNSAALELSRHGFAEPARTFAQRAVAGVNQWPDSAREASGGRNILRASLKVLGDYEAVWQSYDDDSRRRGAQGLGLRILGARYRILMGDTTGVLALVDSARTLSLAAFVGTWTIHGQPRYYGAQLLSLLGRQAEAVAMLRDALNGGWRLVPDEPLYWYWAPIKDYPPFQELMKLKDGS
ncbi:MAG TPA: serine/threonine-protein kinase [Longimicrobiales bacterium]|nr:serine/threonine-protein kinase [Longimicrobiales bacterium]